MWDTNVDRLRVGTTELGMVWGNVGIGTLNPSVKLEIDWNIKIGDEGSMCNPGTAWEIKYEVSLNKHQWCDGTSWNNLY